MKVNYNQMRKNVIFTAVSKKGVMLHRGENPTDRSNVFKEKLTDQPRN